MSMSTEYIIDRIDEATRFTRDYKQVCNDALCLARGRLASLQNSVEAKDKRIEELEAEVLDLKARELVEDNCVIMQDSSGNLTIKCSSGSDDDRWIQKLEKEVEEKNEHIFKLESELGHLEQEVRDLKSELQNCSEVDSGSVTDGEAVHDINGVVSRSDRNKLYSVIAQCYETTSGSVTDGCEDRWIPCSERLPDDCDCVLMQLKNIRTDIKTIRVGFYGCGSGKWMICGIDGERKHLINHTVLAWQPLPEKYEEPVVEDEPEEVKFEIGDFVLCVSKAGVKINAVYTGEDEEHYWIFDKNCLTQQPLDKNRWKLTKYPGYMSIVEWLTYTPVS